MEKDYHLGLDIGTSSVGFAAIDDNFKLIRAKGKQVLGVRLFEEGQTAAERRGYRTARRRLKRRKWRLSFLDEFFAPYLDQVDPNFLRRLKQSNISPNDQLKVPSLQGRLLFPDYHFKNGENGYPTLIELNNEEVGSNQGPYPIFNIYALRLALMKEQRKFDLREVYLAIHHIVKYRGNFLNDTPVELFQPNKLDLSSTLEAIRDDFAQLGLTLLTKLKPQNVKAIEEILLDTSLKRIDRQKNLSNELLGNSDQAASKKSIREITKLILGYKAKINTIFNLEVDNPKDWVISLSQSDSEQQLDKILTVISPIQSDILNKLINLYSQVMLNEIVPNGVTLSEAMVNKYLLHQQQLKVFKQFIAQQPKTKREKLKSLYVQYIGKEGGKKLTKDEFYKELKKALDDSEQGKRIADEIKNENFLLLQRTKENGVIPYQIQQQELDAIIENQAKYYPWLAEMNPVKENRTQAKYKLDQLLTFRVPYYVGPMITKEEQQKTSPASFAWAIRKAGRKESVTPYNFDEQFDCEASANRFIKRMTIKDTYLYTEDVLPMASLLYQRYVVLDELNKISVNGGKLSQDQKHKIYHDLFEKQSSVVVTVKDLKKWWSANESTISPIEVKGLADEKKFTSNLRSYHDLKSILGEEVLKDPHRQSDLENILEWATIFEDTKIFRLKLEKLTWLTPKQRERLAQLRYRGWGRLSRQLLAGLVDQNGERIIDCLWNTSGTFMHIINTPAFAKAVDDYNKKEVGELAETEEQLVERILEEAYTSPQNKKAIHQTLKVVKDITKAAGKAPKTIAIEFARNSGPKQRSKTRIDKLQKIFATSAKELVRETNLKEELDNIKDLTDRYYLYFTQAGRDIYNDQPIDIDRISIDYDIDHILPRTFIKDDSLDNKVLVSKTSNGEKGNRVPIRLFGQHRGLWKQLMESGLITRQKYERLMLDPDKLDEYKALRFINRQLVETRQVIKLTANILSLLFKDTQIIETRAQHTKHLREIFELPKVREVNDYHHAMDAFLTAFGAQYLYQRYPNLRSFFVYGQFLKGKPKDLPRKFNFFNDLAKIEPERITYNKNVVNPQGDFILNSEDMAKYLGKILLYKVILVSKECRWHHGRLFKATINPAKGNKEALIPIKQNMAPQIYGGYTGEQTAFMTVVRIEAKNSAKYQVVGIPVRALQTLDKALQQGEAEYQKRLNQLIEQKLGKKEFKVVLSHLPFGQLIIDGNKQFTLGSANYRHNFKQLYLSEQSLKLLANNFAEIRKLGKVNDQSNALVGVFDEIVSQMDKGYDLYDQRNNREKVKNGRELFLALPNFDDDSKKSSKVAVIIKLLQGLHANPKVVKLPELKIPVFAKFQERKMYLSKDAIFVYRSPSGLFERKVKLSSL